MATLANLQVYEQARQGKRVFTLPCTRAKTVRMGLWRMGYKVRMETRGDVVLLVISE